MNLHYYVVTARDPSWPMGRFTEIGVVASMTQVAQMQVSLCHPNLEIVAISRRGDVDLFHEAEQAATMPKQTYDDGTPLKMMAEITTVDGTDTGQLAWVRVPNNCTVHPGDAATLIRIRALLNDLSLERRGTDGTFTRFAETWAEEFELLLHWSESLDG